MVAFWSGYCSHCVRYDEYFNSFAARHPELGFIVIASRQGEPLAEIQAKVAERHLTFPLVVDNDAAVAEAWLAHQTPRVYLLDQARKLLYRGAVDNFKFVGDPEREEYLEPAITQFLNGEPVRRAETASFGCAIKSVYYILPKPL